MSTARDLLADAAALLRCVALDAMDADWHREVGRVLDAVERLEEKE